MAEAGNETSRLPLSALLSQVLVAFTIECDNEFERQLPHRAPPRASHRTASSPNSPKPA